MKHVHFAAAAIFLAASACRQSDQPTQGPVSGGQVPQYVTAAVADSGRDAQRADDAKRHPAEIVAFSGAKPGDKVFELIPGSGYWTRILSKVVGPEGRVDAVWPLQYARYSVGDVQQLAAAAKQPAYNNVSVQVLPTAELSSPEPVDVVFTSMNYHDYPAEFMGDLDPSVLNKAVFAMLKPGGTYVVIDHRAAPGTTVAQTRDLHRIDPALVRQQAEQAGFQFAGETAVLHRTDDDPKLKVFDPKVRGHTDKFALKFRKPATGGST